MQPSSPTGWGSGAACQPHVRGIICCRSHTDPGDRGTSCRTSPSPMSRAVGRSQGFAVAKSSR